MATGRTDRLPAAADVLVLGAGIVGASIAARLAAAGCDVCLLDRRGPAAGATSSGEGNILVSDKLPGPELELALRSVELWRQLAAQAGQEMEFEEKGGVVVAHDDEQLAALAELVDRQRSAGVRVELVDRRGLGELEPYLSRNLPGGAFYQDDCQVQPMRAVAELVRRARAVGCAVCGDAEVLRARRGSGGRLTAVETGAGTIEVGSWVVNATGPWSGEVAMRLGGHVRVRPRRGHVLVTEPVAPLVVHKVYEADYVATVHDDAAAWSCSSVVESTASGTVLIGSSREFVGFSGLPDLQIVAAVAARAIVLFPALADVRLLRTYVGFRPATPDHLPVIGADGQVEGLLHASGHEGAGIGLSLATAELVAAMVLGKVPAAGDGPFAPGRFPSVEPAETSPELPRPEGGR